MREAFDSQVQQFDLEALQLSRAYLRALIKAGNNSSPGKDRITFRAYRPIEDLAVGALWRVALGILQGVVPPEDWNHSIFCALAKKATHVEPDGSTWHLPKDIRPLSVVNSDNRLVANLFRLPIAPQACKLVHPSQRGFLADRLLLDNVLDLAVPISSKLLLSIAIYYN